MRKSILKRQLHVFPIYLQVSLVNGETMQTYKENADLSKNTNQLGIYKAQKIVTIYTVPPCIQAPHRLHTTLSSWPVDQSPVLLAFWSNPGRSNAV